MEKSMATISTNGKSNVRRSKLHIPNDLFFSILSKLPIKSLRRFECVCKSWSLLFDNPNFITIYRNCLLTKDHSYYNDKSLLLHNNLSAFGSYYSQEKYELYSVSGDRFSNRVKLDWPNIKLEWPINPPDEYNCGFNILGCGSVNGILFLYCAFRMYVILWNPTTKEFKVIPPSNLNPILCWIDHHGFGYDHIKDDYKVIRHSGIFHDTNSDVDEQISSSIWEIYSLRSNSWKKLEVDVKHKFIRWNDHFVHVYMDGLSHGLGGDDRDNELCLVSFDWSNEVFVTTPLPSYIDDSFDFDYSLMLLNGSIALISNYKDDAFHISILGELGVEESWIKFFIIGPLPCLEYPIGAGKKGDMLFKKKGGGLVWFDLNTQMIEDLDIAEDIYKCRLIIHKENLTPFEGNNI